MLKDENRKWNEHGFYFLNALIVEEEGGRGFLFI